jgi:serine/threonine protein kinase
VGEAVPGGDGGGLAAFAPGSRVAGYLLEEEIGEGGMAVVFRARDERLGRLVALKILAPGLAAEPASPTQCPRASATPTSTCSRTAYLRSTRTSMGSASASLLSW